MASMLVALFQTQEKAPKVSNDLEQAGIKNSDYIIYKTDNEDKLPKTSVWQRFFGHKKPQFIRTEADKLITSVEIHNNDEYTDVTKVFKTNEAVHIYEFKDMTIEEAKDLNYIKKAVEIKAKSQIFNVPSNKKYAAHEGMTSEVKI